MKIRYACEYSDSFLERHISICQNKIYAAGISDEHKRSVRNCVCDKNKMFFLLQDSDGHVHIRMI